MEVHAIAFGVPGPLVVLALDGHAARSLRLREREKLGTELPWDGVDVSLKLDYGVELPFNGRRKASPLVLDGGDHRAGIAVVRCNVKTRPSVGIHNYAVEYAGVLALGLEDEGNVFLACSRGNPGRDVR